MEWYNPTKEERETIERAGLKSAWQELQPLLNEKAETPVKVLAGIKAFRAAKKAIDNAIKDLEKKTGNDVSCWPEVFSIVASAAYALDVDDIDDVHPYCVGGERLEAVMRAAIAMRGIYMTWDAFEDEDDSVFGIFLDEEAKRLADALKA